MTMDRMPDSERVVVVGVDTHRDTHTAAVLDTLGTVLDTAVFPTDRGGYRALLGWVRSFGTVSVAGVEGTGSWGAGLTRWLSSEGVEVVEVIRPNRQTRRRYGKSDTTDAIAAARAVLSGEASGRPRAGHGPVESIRLLQLTRSSAIKQRTMVANQIHAVIATAVEPLRAQLRGIPIRAVADTAARYRPGDAADPGQAAKIALKALGARYRYLDDEITELDTHLKPLVTETAPPELMAEVGVGIQTAADLLLAAGSDPSRMRSEASYAALCGVSPVDASSGRQTRHRLNRGGDRQANAALYRIVIVRLRYHQPTRDYLARRISEGRTKPEAIRCLKRYLARRVWKHLATKPT